MTFRLALSAAILLAAGTAQARTPTTTVLQAATPEASAKPQAEAEKKYCVRTTISGSRMPQKTCRTRKAWMASGFDPLNPNG